MCTPSNVTIFWSKSYPCVHWPFLNLNFIGTTVITGIIKELYNNYIISVCFHTSMNSKQNLSPTKPLSSRVWHANAWIGYSSLIRMGS